MLNPSFLWDLFNLTAKFLSEPPWAARLVSQQYNGKCPHATRSQLLSFFTIISFPLHVVIF
jgi:hypothetical protein